MHEFQAVILALEYEGRLFPLTENIHKAMLPVGNRPLLEFQLQLLENAGFQNAILVVSEPKSSQVIDFVSQRASLVVEVVVVPENYGSADGLRFIAHKLTSDFIVLSGSLVTDVIVHYLADIHRTNDSTVTMLLHKKEKEKKELQSSKSKKNKDKEKPKSSSRNGPFETEEFDRYYVSVKKKENRLIYFRSAGDVEYDMKLPVSKELLRKEGAFSLTNELRDAQLCIFSHWVIRFLEKKADISSIQEELIPFLVSSQYDRAPDFFEGISLPETHHLASFSVSTSSYRSFLENPIRCFAFVAPDSSFCYRTNSLGSYLDMNLKVPVLPTSNETPWPPFLPLDACKNKDIKVKATFVADEVVFGKQVILESCVIGKGCILGNNVTIRNSILWDGVVIEKGQDDGIKAKSPHVD